MKILKISMCAAMIFSLSCEFSGCKSKKEKASAVEEEIEIVETEPGNEIKNGNFERGKKFWMMWLKTGIADQIFENGEMEIRIKDAGYYEYGIQPFYDGFALYKGGVYKYSFDVRSTIERTFEWRLQLNGGDYHAYATAIESIGPETKRIECTFSMPEESDYTPRLVYNLGRPKGSNEKMPGHSVFFDNVRLELIDSSKVTDVIVSTETSDVNVNQIGYLPNDTKIAVVRSKKAISGKFSVINVETNSEVFTGKLSKSKKNASSQEQTALADFSALKVPGTYKITTENNGASFAFKIGNDIYTDLLQSTIKMFNLQRCGNTTIDDKIFKHPACHTGKALVWPDKTTAIDVSGGWHDAGDYGRYVVPGAKAVADLMLTYENYPKLFSVNTNILEEIVYELDWMEKMQDKKTGGVYHKVTCADFPSVVMPQDEKEQLYLSPISTTATADFAATMAMAYRVMHSSKYKELAEKAWNYLEANPNLKKGFTNPYGITTGAYDDNQDIDEKFWALAEMYKSFKDEKYLNALKKLKLEKVKPELGWREVGLYGFYALLTSNAPKDDFYKTVKAAFDKKVKREFNNIEKDAYSVSIDKNDFCWGSNMTVANNGMMFLFANSFSPDKKYIEAAKKQLNYLLGTNTTSYCFVTGFGSLSPMMPHHRPSQVLKKVMPGMLVGGPNSRLDDPFARANLIDAANAACYTDSIQCYSCNEITIYWNSPLVYLITGCIGEK